MIRLNAAARLTAGIGGEPLSDSFGREQVRRFTRLLSKGNVQDLGTKDGLTMNMFNDGQDKVVTLSTDDHTVVAYGKLEDSPYSSRRRMYNLYVDKAWRGKGLANILHLGAVHVLKHLESDTTMAIGALKAFKSLERFGYKLKMLDTDLNKTVAFRWGADGIPTVNGKSIEKADNYALYV